MMLIKDIEIDFRTRYLSYGLQKIDIENEKGDIVETKYYLTDGLPVDINIHPVIIKVTVDVFRTSTSIPESKIITEYFYDTSGTTVLKTNTITEYLSTKRGYQINKKSREKLIENASLWLYGSLIAEYGIAQAKLYIDSLTIDLHQEINIYVTSTKAPLLTAIDEHTGEFLTLTRKNTVKSILDVDYGT